MNVAPTRQHREAPPRSDRPAGAPGGAGRRGFGLVETVIGVAIISAVLFGLAEVGRFAFRAVRHSSLQLRAAFLAEEGLEAARLLRDTSWSGTIATLEPSRDYWLVFSATSWQLLAAPQPYLDGRFERTVRLSAVWRSNSSDDIRTSATSSATDWLDQDTEEVRVRVSWSNRGSTSTVEVATYLTNLFHN